MKKVKNKKLFFGIILVVIILGIFSFLKLNEDSWIKNSKGIYVQHGNPEETPEYVTKQINAINCAEDIFLQFENNGMIFSSQCLGACGDYSIDVVHTPRIDEDDLEENQCEEYLDGKTSSFIEFDSKGNIVRII
jgi:hypothetical protein